MADGGEVIFMFSVLTKILLWLVSLAWILIIVAPIVLFLCTLIYVGSKLFNYFAIQYIGRHIDQVKKVELYPSYQTYWKESVPTGYSTDGWSIREHYRYKHIPKGRERKANVYFINNHKVTVIFKEASPIYQEIMARGIISSKQ